MQIYTDQKQISVRIRQIRVIRVLFFFFFLASWRLKLYVFIGGCFPLHSNLLQKLLVRSRARGYIQGNAEKEKKRETFEKVKLWVRCLYSASYKEITQNRISSPGVKQQWLSCAGFWHLRMRSIFTRNPLVGIPIGSSRAQIQKGYEVSSKTGLKGLGEWGKGKLSLKVSSSPT